MDQRLDEVVENVLKRNGFDLAAAAARQLKYSGFETFTSSFKKMYGPVGLEFDETELRTEFDRLEALRQTQYETIAETATIHTISDLGRRAITSLYGGFDGFPPVVCAPTGNLNAFVRPMPDGAEVVIFENDLLVFVGLISKLMTLLLSNDFQFGRPQIDFNFERMIARLESNQTIMRRFKETIEGAAVDGMAARAEVFSLGENDIPIGSALSTIALVFVYGHEWAHVRHGHRKRLADAQAGVNIVHDGLGDFDLRHRFEHEADGEGLSIALHHCQLERYDPLFGLLGPLIFFSALRCLDRALFTLARGAIAGFPTALDVYEGRKRARSTHPSPVHRLAYLLHGLDRTAGLPEHFKERAFRLATSVTSTFEHVAGALESDLLSWHEGGIRPHRKWQSRWADAGSDIWFAPVQAR